MFCLIHTQVTDFCIGLYFFLVLSLTSSLVLFHVPLPYFVYIPVSFFVPLLIPLSPFLSVHLPLPLFILFSLLHLPLSFSCFFLSLHLFLAFFLSFSLPPPCALPYPFCHPLTQSTTKPPSASTSITHTQAGNNKRPLDLKLLFFMDLRCTATAMAPVTKK